ncbi:MAG: FG-GAP repeat domain-containing protein [Thermoanaerobaculia bacterium]
MGFVCGTPRDGVIVLALALAVALAGGLNADPAGAGAAGGDPPDGVHQEGREGGLPPEAPAAPRTAADPAPSPPPSPAAPLYDEVTAAAGIRHVHAKPVLDPKLTGVMPWMTALGAAACTADYDRDGRLDLFVTSSRKGEPNFLYRNDGPGPAGVATFTEVAARAGVAAWNDEGGVAMDCLWGDVDDDGWPDLFIARWGRNLLLRNRGPGPDGLSPSRTSPPTST